NVPAMNVEEQENKYIFSLAVPGMEKEDFTIEVKNGGLSITGKHTHTDTTKQRKYKRREYNYSAFTRFFPLPKDANNMEVDAQYQNGVLVLTVAKKLTKTESGRKIAVH
ncbi:MAG: Hsp20/alpha crystallin family protein, partial [Bacteroidota bacterium]